MKEYKMVCLNKKFKMSLDSDLQQAENVINEYAAEGWELQQIISQNDFGCSMIGVFFKEK